ncbi:hypothetical protein [Cellulophaga sp. L1A9]|uniref:hypothetical protein n=1 Tax=Cellulophaga sp. L1A9 TaxID=2686362 RepID=UPI00131B62BB|nr:hypothetical protein [Cellulophaga sp. L1A9]
MAIPFFGIVHYFSTLNDYQQLNLNDTYRIERTKHQVLSAQRVYIYEKSGILKKNIARPTYSSILEKIGINNSLDDFRKMPIQDATLIIVNKDSIGILYKIADEKK